MANEYFGGGHLRYAVGKWRDDSGDIVDVICPVRCKDCKKFGNDEACPMLSMQAYTEADDFCSCGERKTDGERKNDNGQWDHPAG